MVGERLLHDVALHWPSITAAQAGEWAGRQLAHVHRELCALRGHELRLHFEPCRLSLRCVACGWESSGWTIETPSEGRAHAASQQDQRGTRSRHPA